MRLIRNRYAAIGRLILRAAGIVAFSAGVPGFAGDFVPAPGGPVEVIHPSILGATSCSTSGCHGGAEEKRLQYTVWSQRDVHSRAYATLATARSARMAEALGLAHATTSPSCTSCHAPLQVVQSLNPALLAPDARVQEGVSCVSCHGPGGDWVRSHTRTDFTHADKVAGGLKDLKNLHARANGCVACHQNIDPELVNKGRHPRLIFELDGQTASEPRHWRETAAYNGGQAWQVGQLVALREMSWALRQGNALPEDASRWQGLLWVLQRAELADASPEVSVRGIPLTPDNESYASAHGLSDRLARSVASEFDAATVPKRLKALAATHVEFAGGATARAELAYRAERLVLALDRLLASLPAEARPAEVSARLDAVFQRAQSIPDFAPEDFASALKEFALALP